MNSDILPKATSKYEPTHMIEIVLHVSVTKEPEKIAAMIGQRAFTIDGVENVVVVKSEIYKAVRL